MNDIAEHLPQQSKTVDAIYAHYKKTGDAEAPRGYLGASVIGAPCERWLWYTFRNCCSENISGRVYRLFETGDLEEARFIKDLEAIGCATYATDQNGEQFEVSASGGHFSGHLDGCALGISEAKKTWHVLEFKTHNYKSFQKLLRSQSVSESYPQHYAQMQVYMHLTGMRRALYLACNKDTDELYSERTHYDKEYAKGLMERAERIIESTQPLERLGTRPDFYQCNWCDAQAICWNDETSERALPVKFLSCRQCCHATPLFQYEDGTPINGAKWGCNKHEVIMDNEKPCDDHLVLPGLIPFAEATNYGKDEVGNDFIEFTNQNGTEWYHGREELAFSSAELMILAPRDLTNSFLLEVKKLFGAVAVSCSGDILDRYPKEDSRTIWMGPLSNLIAAWKEKYNEDLPELEAIAKCVLPGHNVAEYSGGRVAIAYPETKSAEIRQGKE